MSRQGDIDHLYSLLEQLEDRVNGPCRLSNCHGRMDWPKRGIYIFFAPDETRASTDYRRVTRIGTHAVSTGSGTSLWNRLIAHRGTFSGMYADGGNHRGSVFRLRIGEAMIERDDLHDDFPDWAQGSSAGSDIRNHELEHERRVSQYIRDLPFLWVEVDDDPRPDSDRAYLEKNMIALLSNYEKSPIDPRDSSWLGKQSPNETIRRSGLWNVDCVTTDYDPSFFDVLETHLGNTSPVL